MLDSEEYSTKGRGPEIATERRWSARAWNNIPELPAEYLTWVSAACTLRFVNLPELDEVRQDFGERLPFFRAVPLEGWRRAIEQCPSWGDATSRKNLAWNAMIDVALERAPAFGLSVTQIGPPGRRLRVVQVSGERFDYIVRFNALTTDLRAGSSPDSPVNAAT